MLPTLPVPSLACAPQGATPGIFSVGVQLWDDDGATDGAVHAIPERAQDPPNLCIDLCQSDPTAEASVVQQCLHDVKCGQGELIDIQVQSLPQQRRGCTFPVGWHECCGESLFTRLLFWGETPQVQADLRGRTLRIRGGVWRPHHTTFGLQQGTVPGKVAEVEWNNHAKWNVEFVPSPHPCTRTEDGASVCRPVGSDSLHTFVSTPW